MKTLEPQTSPELDQKKLLQIVRWARELKTQRRRGAAVLEILVLVAYRGSLELELAKKAILKLQPEDLYLHPPVSFPIKTAPFLDAVSWVINHDWPRGGSGFDPVLRIQKIVSGKQRRLQNQSAESAIDYSILADQLVMDGDQTGAFRVLKKALGMDKEETLTTRAALRLFRSVDARDRVSILRYDKKRRVRSFGIAAIPGAGLIATEYSGALLDAKSLISGVSPALPEVSLMSCIRPEEALRQYYIQ